MKNYLQESKQNFFAFNVWDINSAVAVIDGAAVAGKEIILQTSAYIYVRLMAKEFASYVKAYAAKKGVTMYLHLDHCKEIEMIYDAVDSGWDSVMFDGSHLDLDENIRLTKEVCEYAHKKGVLVEGEVGQVKGVEEDIVVRDEAVASLDDVKRYTKETNVDFIAAAFGNAHGNYKGTINLNYELIDDVAGITDAPFVVHGGSGMGEERFRKLFSHGNVKKINIATDLRTAYAKGIRDVYESGMVSGETVNNNAVADKIAEPIKEVVVELLRLV